jgi:hypothetical protein
MMRCGSARDREAGDDRLPGPLPVSAGLWPGPGRLGITPGVLIITEAATPGGWLDRFMRGAITGRSSGL